MMVMNTWIGRLVASVVVIGTAIYLLMRFGPGIPVSSVVTQKQEMFSVSGEGKVTAVPDTGIVSLGITINRPTVKAAQTEVNTKINSITNELKNSGIDPKDIKTENYSVYPEYDYLQGPGRISGYRVTTDIKVTVRQLEKLNEVIDKATAAGANTVSGIQLTVEENRQKELVHQAREEAVKEAKTKAESLASAAGITLGKIINVQENVPGAPVPFMMLDSAAKEGRGGGSATDIQPGSTDIYSTVTLFYETR